MTVHQPRCSTPNQRKTTFKPKSNKASTAINTFAGCEAQISLRLLIRNGKLKSFAQICLMDIFQLKLEDG
jgi:hypothetical protein